ncbi:hypothetical protein ScPMuIL_005419 [Solemya velum]
MVDLVSALVWLLKIYAISSVLFYLGVVYLRSGWKTVDFLEKGSLKAVIVTAHPDDECMFFTPTLLHLVQRGHCVHLVCLSTGNYYSQGAVRTRELFKSCGLLGIPPEKVKIVDNRALPDHPEIKWKEEDIEQELGPLLASIKPDLIITFDEGGVSGHINHRALLPGIRKLLRGGRKAFENTKLYSLQTTGTVRGLLSVLDVPYSWWSCDTVIVSPPGGVVKAWRAMAAHYSQLMWFRVLFSMFTRYNLVNTLDVVH